MIWATSLKKFQSIIETNNDDAQSTDLSNKDRYDIVTFSLYKSHRVELSNVFWLSSKDLKALCKKVFSLELETFNLI